MSIITPLNIQNSSSSNWLQDDSINNKYCVLYRLGREKRRNRVTSLLSVMCLLSSVRLMCHHYLVDSFLLKVEFLTGNVSFSGRWQMVVEIKIGPFRSSLDLGRTTSFVSLLVWPISHVRSCVLLLTAIYVSMLILRTENKCKPWSSKTLFWINVFFLNFLKE